MPLQETSGAASYDAFGGGVPAVPQYIEDVFSTYLYTGTGAALTITNGIDLSTKGGLVWVKCRSTAYSHVLADTARGVQYSLNTNNTNAQNLTYGDDISSANSNGFSIGANNGVNANAGTFASWTFRKQPKFFDIVTYTGDGTAGHQISHSLGSVPGCIIVKCTSAAIGWLVYHTSLGNTGGLRLDTTNANYGPVTWWNSTTPTSTNFTLGGSTGNNAGETFVAYVFAHNAGGFGLTGTDNVISCGSFTTDAGGLASVTLGYEPQWILLKRSSGAGGWYLVDTMRGWSVPISGTTGATNDLYANLSNAEVADELGLPPNATGFSVTTNLSSSSTYIYIAIRRGPMKVPTSGTSVFSPLALNNSSGTTNTTGFPIDLQISAERSAVHATPVNDRLRGVVTTPADNTSSYLRTDSTAVEQPETITRYWNNTGFQTSLYSSGVSSIYWNFRRAPNFFDEVCFTAPTPSTTNLRVNHNLTVAPDLIIAKLRSGADDWWVYASTSALSTAGRSKYLILENTNAIGSSTDCWGTSNPTSTDFGVDTTFFFGAGTVVAYLFATCAGVSKVGSYTGTGALQTVNCGFTSGARFVLIKRTDSTGAWYVWDSARGITSGNDPYLLLNSTAAEITTTNYVDTDTTGFKVTAAAPAALNASGGTYIFLAVA